MVVIRLRCSECDIKQLGRWVLPQRWYLPTKLQDVTTQSTVNLKHKFQTVLPDKHLLCLSSEGTLTQALWIKLLKWYPVFSDLCRFICAWLRQQGLRNKPALLNLNWCGDKIPDSRKLTWSQIYHITSSAEFCNPMQYDLEARPNTAVIA